MSGDEPEIRDAESRRREGSERDPLGDPKAAFGRGEDPDRAVRAVRRGPASPRTLPARGDRPEPVLQLVDESMEAGKRRLAEDAARQATNPEVKDLRAWRPP